jgi:hypothetical protein
LTVLLDESVAPELLLIDNKWACSAIISLPPSRHLLFQPVFVVQTTTEGMGHYPQMRWKPVPVLLQQSRQG